MFKFFNRLFFKGLIVVLPVTLTIYLLVTISTKVESLFAPFIKNSLGPEFYIPGGGIILTVIFVMTVGVLVSNFITGTIIKFFIGQFEKVPFIKAIYNPLKDLMGLFGGNSQEKMKKVVAVDMEQLGFETLGLVTREDFSEFGEGTVDEGKIAVYIPMSYMLGGQTILVNRERVREVDIPVEKAFKLALTAWIGTEKR